MQARRLKSREQFQAVLAATKVARTEHFVMHCMNLESADATETTDLFPAGGPWLGAMVPKRWARRAVTRNLIKRQIYSLSMLCDPALPPAAYLIRLYRGFDVSQFRSAASTALSKAIRAEICALLDKTSHARARAC